MGRSSTITARFSEAMDEASVGADGTFVLHRKKNGVYLDTPVTAQVTYDPTTRTAKLSPANALASGANYRATVTTDANDLAGNPLAVEKVWTFKTR